MLRVSSVVIGLTIVAYGTSAPELVVGAVAALRESLGAPDAAESTQLAIGNAVGSNIANIALILGLAAVVRPMSLERRVVTTDLPVLMAGSIAFVPIVVDGTVSRIEGAILVGACVVYTLWCVRLALSERRASDALATANGCAPAPALSVRARDVAAILGGLGGLALGAHALVTGACTIAESLGVSKLVVGVTIVAVGTSLPELAASVVASARGEEGLSVGNVVGSNLFNLTLVVGVAALITPLHVPGKAVLWDIIPMLVVTTLLLALVTRASAVRRWHGALLLALFVLYITACVLRESRGWA